MLPSGSKRTIQETLAVIRMMKGKLIILFLISLSILACKNKSESRNVELSVKTENKTSSEQQIMYSEEETVVVSELSCNCRMLSLRDNSITDVGAMRCPSHVALTALRAVKSYVAVLHVY